MNQPISFTNMNVRTPLGDGVVDGFYAITDGEGNEIVTGVGVRLPVNDETSKYLKQSNCMTPKARMNGIWIFNKNDVHPITGRANQHRTKAGAVVENVPAMVESVE